MADQYIALDIETTGLDVENDAIIEVGLVRFEGERILETFQSFTNPGRPIPAFITEMTGIRDEDVHSAPPAAALKGRLYAFVRDLPIVGHSIGFDMAFMRRLGLFRANPAYDTLELASILLPNAGRYSLAALGAQFKINLPNTHRALPDARLAHLLFCRLLELVAELPTGLLHEIISHARRVNWSLSAVFADALAARAQDPFRGRMTTPLPRKPQPQNTDAGFPFHVDPPDGKALRPNSRTVPLDENELAALLKDGSSLAQILPSFEYRPQQVEMLRGVIQALNEGKHLLAEAGTGTGKSLSYLIPAIHWAVRNNERVVISTNTINLQDQLIHKDVPDLQRALPFEFRAAVLKGRANYLCPRLFQTLRHNGPNTPEEMRLLAKLLVWLPQTETADRAELTLHGVENEQWSRISAENEGCTIERCANFAGGVCPFWRARREAECAHMVIVNHALLLADIGANGRVLPEYRYLVVDEAHHLEEATTNGLSFHCDRPLLDRLLNEAIRSKSGLLSEIQSRCRASLPALIQAEIDQVVLRCSDASELARTLSHDFFAALVDFLHEHRGEQTSDYSFRIQLRPDTRSRPGWQQVQLTWNNLARQLSAVAEGVNRVMGRLAELEEYDIPDWEDLTLHLNGLSRDLAIVRVNLSEMMDNPSPAIIYWAELEVRAERVSLHAAPLHVGPLVEKHLFEPKKSVILTSATLRTSNDFGYIRERLNAHEAEELAVGTPFDYNQSTLVYMLTDIAEPNQPGYQRGIEKAIIALCKELEGRTLVLFTSHSQLKQTAARVTGPLAHTGIVVFEQGDGTSRQQLIESFRLSQKAVLLGTRSFWEGVDIAGQALSCLVIVRLPFAVPTDPINAARAATFEDSFNDYSLPEAVLRFRQGFGRLIRTKTDRGVVVVLDRRILTKQYGIAFLDALPECKRYRGTTANLPWIAKRWIDGEEGQ